jgi:hypothetical protein
MKRSHQILAPLLVVTAVLALSAAPALAEQARLFSGSFGGASSTTPDPYPLAQPADVAVNEQTGDVYVANQAVDDVQNIVVEANGGTFELVFEDPFTHIKQTTAPIVDSGQPESKASDEEVENALTAAGAGVGTVHVRGSGRTTYIVEFRGALTGVDVATMTADGSGLTGGSVQVATTTVGLPGDDVEKFGPSGEFLLVFGKDVNKTKVDGGLASEAEENVCTDAEVAMGGECQGGVEGQTPGAFVQPSFLAVDNSSGPSRGSVYVADEGDGLVTKFDEEGIPVATWGNNGPGESANGQLIGKSGEDFGILSGIAVDGSGNLWVDGSVKENGSAAEDQRISEFKQDASFVTDWVPRYDGSPMRVVGSFERGVTVDSEDNLYLTSEGTYVKFDSAGNEVGRIDEDLITGVRTSGLAVDSGDDIYLDAESHILVYASCHPQLLGVCQPTGSFGATHPVPQAQLAVDSASSADTVYAAGRQAGQVLAFSEVNVPDVSTGEPSGLTSNTVTLNGTVDPSGVAVEECFFEYGESESYGNKAPCEHPGAVEVGSGTGAVGVHAVIPRPPSGKSYHYRLVADNVHDVSEPSEGQDLVLGPPRIVSESSAGVTSTSATVVLEVEPENLATRVHVEYGTSSDYGQASTTVEVAAGSGAQDVPFSLVSLSPNTAYHYRAVAESALAEGAESVVGADQAFTTQGAGGFTLPDGRQWEMVSPVAREGALLEPITDEDGVIQAAATGGAISYPATNPTESGSAGYPNLAQVLSTRAADGWVSRDISLPHESTVPITPGRLNEYTFFSSDLSLALVQPFGKFVPTLSAEASEQTGFLRSDFDNGNLGEPCESSCYRPLVTGKAPFANVAEGVHFGEEAECPEGGKGAYQSRCGPQVVDATPDAHHVLLTSSVALTEGGGPGLYEWTAGKLTYIGNVRLAGLHGAVSEDGSHVVVQSITGASHLYTYDSTTGASIQLDAAEAGCGTCVPGPSPGEFQFASSHGERVLFTDTEKLTADGGTYKFSGGLGQPADLYECEIVEGACKLSDLAPSGGVIGSVIGAGEDGSWVYFVANGVLDKDGKPIPGAVGGSCETGTGGTNGTCNLYVSHNGATSLIAVLSGADSPDWSFRLAGMTARVSPNGEWLAFMSQRSLTGYDNRDASSGQPDEEVYLYDASNGHLTCASCNVTGARPHGVQFSEIGFGGGTSEGGLAGGQAGWGHDQWLAANLPTWTPFNLSDALYQSRYLSNSGRLFFNSSDALVPLDVNGNEDVYEFEPEGEGPQGAACGPDAVNGSDVLKSARGYEVEARPGQEGAGCVGLISSGSSSGESAFVDASETGGDVFFLTHAHLVSSDVESGVALYDAQECTSSSPCPPAPVAQSPECVTAEGCRAAPEPQPAIFGSPSSATFKGIGNVIPEAVAPKAVKVTKKAARCRKPKKLSHGKCVKAKAKAGKKAKKSTHRKGSK